jgi:hypothetical protein
MRIHALFLLGIFYCAMIMRGASSGVNQPAQIVIPPLTPYAIKVQDGNTPEWQRIFYVKSPSGGIATNTQSYAQ